MFTGDAGVRRAESRNTAKGGKCENTRMTGEERPQARKQSPDGGLSEADLIARILQGEKELFYELIRPCERSVFLTAYSVLQNSSDAEEVAQEAVLKAFRHLAEFRGESRFATWLLRIALNEARMRLRKQHRPMWESLDAEPEDEEQDYVPKEFGDWGEIPSEALERKEIREILGKALGALSPIYREVIVLRDVRQMSITETAEILGVREGVVKTRLLRARLQMRDLIASHAPAKGFFSRNLFRKGKSPWF